MDEERNQVPPDLKFQVERFAAILQEQERQVGEMMAALHEVNNSLGRIVTNIRAIAPGKRELN